jgi:hypothetical protein
MSRIFFRFAGFALSVFILSCASTRSYEWQQSNLREALMNLQKSCKLTSKSGFTAEAAIPSFGTARIDAAWDSAGNLNGQIVNTLGEDLLNFKIDGSGILQSDVGVRKDLALGIALDFLAELGTSKTRLLLCSGLFIASSEEYAQEFGREKSQINFNIKSTFSQWQVKSELTPMQPEDPKPQDSLKIKSDVQTPGLFLNRTVANIEWIGTKKNGLFRPLEMTVKAGPQSIKLSFLDFE